MTDIPQLGPEVWVDDSDDITRQSHAGGMAPLSPFFSPFQNPDPRQDFITHGWETPRRRANTGATETSIVGTPRELIGPAFPLGLSPIPSPKPSPARSHKTSQGSFDFSTGELGELGDGSEPHRRRGSTVENVLDVLDNSAWGASIRRSFTLRRPSGGEGPL